MREAIAKLAVIIVLAASWLPLITSVQSAKDEGVKKYLYCDGVLIKKEPGEIWFLNATSGQYETHYGERMYQPKQGEHCELTSEIGK